MPEAPGYGSGRSKAQIKGAAGGPTLVFYSMSPIAMTLRSSTNRHALGVKQRRIGATNEYCIVSAGGSAQVEENPEIVRKIEDGHKVARKIEDERKAAGNAKAVLDWLRPSSVFASPSANCYIY